MLRALLPALLIFACGAAQAQDAGALRARHASLRAQLADSPFGRPLHVTSSAASGAHKGEITAVIEQPFGVVAPALSRAAHWCDILTLQVNIKRCSADGDKLAAFITRKARDAADSAHRVDFRYEVAATSADYLRVGLDAPVGPVGTRDYKVLVEAAPLDAKRTVLHMSYAYTLGTVARLAMETYLAGSGGSKPGFSVPGGERGVVERGAMRYYLAVESYLESLAAPADKRLETRLRDWYGEIARYPQLREQVALEEYVDMKLRGPGRSTP